MHSNHFNEFLPLKMVFTSKILVVINNAQIKKSKNNFLKTTKSRENEFNILVLKLNTLINRHMN